MSDPIDPAIVVARDVIFGQVVGDYFDHPHSIALDEAEELARAALEAAAPMISAKALREAAEAMRSCKDPGHWNLRDPQDPETSYSPDAWLLARAAADLEAGQS